MASFDYDNYKAVGIVENIPATNHSFIHVIGYSNMYSNNIYRYTSDEARTIFSKKGRVFAYTFGQRNPDLDGHCVSLAVMPNEKPGEGLDEYVWDWGIDVLDIASPVIKIAPDSLGNNGQNNYDILNKHNLLDVNTDTYIESNGCVYLVKANSIERMIKYWTFSDLEVKCSESSVLMHNGKLYIAGSLCANSGVIDITTDEQLVDWFCKKVLKPRWDEFLTNRNFKDIESHVKEVLSSVNLDSSIYNGRLKRLKTINTNVQLSFENLQDISANPWFSNILQSAVARFKENYVTEVEKANAEEIKRLQKEHDAQIAVENQRYVNATKDAKEEYNRCKSEFDSKVKSFKDEITLKELELADIDSQISDKRLKLVEEENKWARIEEKKDAIIEDFSVIRDVLNIKNSSSSTSVKLSSNTFLLSSLEIEHKPSEFVQVFMKRLELILQSYGIDDSDAENTMMLLSQYLVTLSNDIRVINSIIKATGNCKYYVEYVTPKWTSFEDLWNNGFSSLVTEAAKNTDIIYYLVLRNMNLSYIPSYIQPLLDIQNGLCETIYVTGLKLPQNLRILGHVTDDSLIPINIHSIEDIGCIKKFNFKKRKIDFNSLQLPEGYLPPSIVTELTNESGNVISYIEDYISEDE